MIDHYQTVTKHRTWAEMAFHSKPNCIRSAKFWFSLVFQPFQFGKVQISLNARKVFNNAFFQNQHLMPNLMLALCVTP